MILCQLTSLIIGIFIVFYLVLYMIFVDTCNNRCYRWQLIIHYLYTKAAEVGGGMGECTLPNNRKFLITVIEEEYDFLTILSYLSTKFVYILLTPPIFRSSRDSCLYICLMKNRKYLTLFYIKFQNIYFSFFNITRNWNCYIDTSIDLWI
jgi:hypothetical protein